MPKSGLPRLPFEYTAGDIRDIIFILGLDGRIVWANRAAEPLGRGKEFLADLLTPASADVLHSRLRASGSGDPASLSLAELDFIQPDLSARRVEFSFSPIESGLFVVAIGRGLAQRASLQVERRRAEFQTFQFQAALIELSGSMTGSLDEMLARITGVSAATLDVARVAVWLFDDDRGRIVCRHAFDRYRKVQDSGAVLDVQRYPRHFEALKEARTIAARDARTDPLTGELASDYLIPQRVTSLLDVPVRREGRTIGVLCHEHKGAPRDWSLDERNFAGSLADLVALAIETSQRREAEAHLRESFEQLDLFFSQSLDGFFFMMLDEPIEWGGNTDKEKTLEYVFDHQRITKINGAMLAQYGATHEQMAGITPRRLFAHGLDHGKDLWRRMFDHGRLHVESDERRLDGSRMWVEGDYICFYDERGRITGHFGIQRDITERKLSEEALQRYNKRISLLQQMGQAILAARSVDEIAQAALTHLRELVPCRVCSVIEFHEKNQAARLLGVHTDGGSFRAGMIFPLDRVRDIESLRSGHVQMQETAGYSKLLNTGRLRSLISVPLIGEGVLIGVLNMGSDVPGVFADDHIEIAREVASSIAVAIRQARLNQQIGRHASELEFRVAERTAELSEANGELRRTIVDREIAERAQRESEERLTSVFRSAMDSILVLDENRRIVIFNRAAEKVFRCAADDAMGRRFDMFASPELKTQLIRYIDSGAPDHRITQGPKAVRKNRESFVIEASLSRAEISTGTLFTVILRDLNEQKRAQEMLDQLQRENVYLHEELDRQVGFDEIVGASPAMQKVFSSIGMVAGTDSTVLLLGETGTGKELIARSVHERSRRRLGVMVKINCAALPANLVESELFGHEKGAFTGAVSQKTGRFELANGGTIFLDEVGELPLEAQTKLLRILQEQEFERVGGSRTIKVDVRVIAATNRNLQEEVRRGAFRADLYYRLNVFPIDVPPLRERKEDIPILAGHFVRRFAQRMGKRIDSISREMCDRMLDYAWPGNVRELANVMERAVILCQGKVLDRSHIDIAGAKSLSTSAGFPTLEQAERDLIRRALEQTGGVLAGPNGAARVLGINRSTLWSRMRKLGIEIPGQQRD